MYRMQFKGEVMVCDNPISFKDFEICLQGDKLLDNKQLVSKSNLEELYKIITKHSFLSCETVEECSRELWLLVMDNMDKIDNKDVTLARVCFWNGNNFCVKYSDKMMPTTASYSLKGRKGIS